MRADRLGPALATQAALATTIVLVVFGSSGVQALRSVGSPLRWVALAALTLSAARWAWVEGARFRRVAVLELPVLGLGALALSSVGWSVAPRLTFERAATFLIALVAAACLSEAAGRTAKAATDVAVTIVATAAAVCAGGVIVYAVDPSVGAQAAAPGIGFRFSGLGENPNTIPMLAAIAIPFCVPVAARGRRLLAVVSALVFWGEIVASGSRGALAGLAAATVVVALAWAGSARRLVAALVAAGIVIGAAVGSNQLIQSVSALPLSSSGGSTVASPLPRAVLPSFADELGSLTFRGRRLIGNDGRFGAWQEAFDQGSQRPALGFGFGTEEEVFIDRLAQFHASRPENSYFGLYLELGGAGVALLLAFGAFLAIATFRARRIDAAAVGAAAAVAAAYALALGQSFVYAAGNVAMLTFWIAAFLLLRRIGVDRVVRAPRALALVALLALLAIPLGRFERSRAIDAQRHGIERVWHAVGGRVDAPGLDGFRLSPPVDCLLYRGTAYEVCFYGGRIVEAYDRRNGFHGWTLQPYAYAGAPISVPAAAVQRALDHLHAHGPKIGVGPAYLARRAG